VRCFRPGFTCRDGCTARSLDDCPRRDEPPLSLPTYESREVDGRPEIGYIGDDEDDYT
jgi:hypothetical protein